MKISTLQIHRVLCGNNVDLDDLSCLVTIAGPGSNIRTTTIFDWTSTVSPRIRSSLMLLPDVPSVLFAIAATIQLCRLSSRPYGEAKGETPSFRFLDVGTNAQGRRAACRVDRSEVSQDRWRIGGSDHPTRKDPSNLLRAAKCRPGNQPQE